MLQSPPSPGGVAGETGSPIHLPDSGVRPTADFMFGFPRAHVND